MSTDETRMLNKLKSFVGFWTKVVSVLAVIGIAEYGYYAVLQYGIYKYQDVKFCAQDIYTSYDDVDHLGIYWNRGQYVKYNNGAEEFGVDAVCGGDSILYQTKDGKYSIVNFTETDTKELVSVDRGKIPPDAIAILEEGRKTLERDFKKAGS